MYFSYHSKPGRAGIDLSWPWYLSSLTQGNHAVAECLILTIVSASFDLYSLSTLFIGHQHGTFQKTNVLVEILKDHAVDECSTVAFISIHISGF